MKKTTFNHQLNLKILHKKTKKIKKRLGLFYLVSTKNSTVATFVDFQTKQTLSVCHIGHTLKAKKLGRVHRRSIEAHKVWGADLRYSLDRYFFKEENRHARRERLKRDPIPNELRISDCRFKFIVYFKGPSRYRRVVMQEFTKRFIREKEEEKAPDIWHQYYIVFFTDLTSIPHNGCRARKVKRTRLKRKPKIFRKK